MATNSSTTKNLCLMEKKIIRLIMFLYCELYVCEIAGIRFLQIPRKTTRYNYSMGGARNPPDEIQQSKKRISGSWNAFS